MYRTIVILLILCFAMSACGRKVEVIQANQFKLMADRMPNELIAREILDSDRDYVPGTWELYQGQYGNILYTRLVADVVFGEIAITSAGNTFSDIVRLKPKENTMHMRPHGFGIVNKKLVKSKRKSSATIERRLDVDMVAITDWDGDQQKDWLIACTLIKSKGAAPRIYYVVVPNPPIAGKIRGSVVAVYDDMGAFGRLYMGQGAVQSNAPVEDVVPGLKPITTPPSANNNSKSTKIKERVLD